MPVRTTGIVIGAVLGLACAAWSVLVEGLIGSVIVVMVGAWVGWAIAHWMVPAHVDRLIGIVLRWRHLAPAWGLRTSAGDMHRLRWMTPIKIEKNAVYLRIYLDYGADAAHMRTEVGPRIARVLRLDHVEYREDVERGYGEWRFSRDATK